MVINIGSILTTFICTINQKIYMYKWKSASGEKKWDKTKFYISVTIGNSNLI